MKIRSLAVSALGAAILVCLALYGSRMYRQAAVLNDPPGVSSLPSTVGGAPSGKVCNVVEASTELTRAGYGNNLAAAPTARSPSMLAWRSAMAGKSMEGTALDLLASANSDDWMRASALHILCISGVENMDASEFGATFATVVNRASERCGGLGTTAFLPYVASTTPKAKQANNALALAPSLTNATVEQGLSVSERDRLQALFADSERATLWLVRNSSRLHSTLANVEALAAYSWQDLGAASVVALCLRDVDCGEGSVLSLRLCLNAGRKVCSERGVLDALQRAGPERAQRINAAAQQIEVALSQGKPEMLGLRLKSP